MTPFPVFTPNIESVTPSDDVSSETNDTTDSDSTVSSNDDSDIPALFYQDSRIQLKYPASWTFTVDSDGNGVRFETPNTNFCGVSITDVAGVPNMSLEFLVSVLDGSDGSIQYLDLNGSRVARIIGKHFTIEGEEVPLNIQAVHKFDSNYILSCHGLEGDADAEFQLVFDTFQVNA
ncbi:hypothetical protein [Granulosicoccus antarcticus]|uniref:Uncharacterized protein n=1 Tax=Granulosicoccus antarcticus IMCC3135 TaxID=1192854 RepID=A0A2Z2NVZ9_9GAMM|nr:hypothetical protein [Granulosicoccus antarcticus]ASJ73898.1 hypothetical protein IMCC3135_19095 [Granulosicoccus antarcticus IMCC3135]